MVNLKRGDCIELFEDIANDSIDTIIADPPYGIDYQSARRIDKSQRKPKILNDKDPFLDWIPNAFRVMRRGGALICFCRWDVEEQFKNALEDAGFLIKSQIIWDKVIHGMGDLKSSFSPLHENMWFATKGAFEFWGNRPKSIIRAQRVSAEKLIHPNEKPVNLLKQIIYPISKTQSVVLDPFMGSGVSGVACVSLGINFVGFELDDKYFKIAERRINNALAKQGEADLIVSPDVTMSPLFRV